MRPFIVKAILQHEMLEMVRDRRALISMVAVPLVVFPLLISVMTRIVPRLAEKSETSAKSATLAVRGLDPELRAALETSGLKLTSAVDLKDAVMTKTAAAAVEEITGPPHSCMCTWIVRIKPPPRQAIAYASCCRRSKKRKSATDCGRRASMRRF